MLIGAVQQLLHHGLRRGTGRPCDALAAGVQWHSAQQMDRHTAPDVGDGVVVFADGDAALAGGGYAAVAELVEHHQQEPLPGQRRRRVGLRQILEYLAICRPGAAQIGPYPVGGLSDGFTRR